MKKYTRFVLAAACIAAFFLAGCGSGNTSRSGSSTAASTGEKEIMMWLVGSEGQAQTISEIAKEFYKDTKIMVRCEAVSWSEAHSKYLTSIAGGVAPDIGTMGLTWGTEFGSLGAMVDLSREYPADVEKIKAAAFPGMWNSIEYKGSVYGIPFDITEYILYYRNDIISAPPTTWEELVSLLADLNKEGRSMLFDWGSMSWVGYSNYLWQAGGDYYSPDYKHVTIDSAEGLAGLKFFTDLYIKYGVPKTKIPLEQGIRTGDFPIAISGNWKIDGLRLSAPEISGKWSIALLPKGPSGKRTAFVGGRILGIFSQSKNKPEAWEFIKFLFSPATQEKLYEGALLKQDTYLPPNMNAWDNLGMDAIFKEILVEQANDTKGPPPILNWDLCTTFVDEMIQKVILQNAEPKRELAACRAELERLLYKK